MALALLIGEDQNVANWAYETYKIFPIPVKRALGVLDTTNAKLVGAALFQNYIGTNVDLSYYGESTLSAGIVRSLAKVALDMGVARGTVITTKRNRRFIKGLLKLGFKLEGTMRCFYGHTDNNRNTGVRLVIFRDGLEHLATPKKDSDAVLPQTPSSN